MRNYSIAELSVRNVLVLALLAVLAVAWRPAPVYGQEPPKTLTISKIERIPLDGPGHPEDAESLYYLVYAAYPQDWQDEVQDTFKVMIDGHVAHYEGGGGGFGGGEAESSFWVYLGAPGKKKIEVTLVHEGKTIHAEKEFTVEARPALRLLDHYDGESFFKDEALRFLCFSTKDVAITVNGKAVEPESMPVEGFDGISILTIAPSLRPGINSIEYSGADAEGKRFSHTASFYFAANNKLKVGDHILFTYGGPKSKSGPFYYVYADGTVLVSGGSVQWKSVLVQGAKKLITDHEVFGFPITAKAAGSGGVALFVKSNFLLHEELDKKIDITVEP